MFIELIIICTPSRHLDLVFEFGFSVCDESLQFGPLTAHSAGAAVSHCTVMKTRVGRHKQ